MTIFQSCNNPCVACGQYNPQITTLPQQQLLQQPIQDSVNLSCTPKEIQQSNISPFRLVTGMLTDEQVNIINQTGRLPDNAKFILDENGRYRICNNFFNARVGTHQLPAGFEVHKNVLGFATVLPKGSEGLFLQKNTPNTVQK